MKQHEEPLEGMPNNEYIWKWMSDPGHLAPRGPAWAPAIMLVDEIDLHLHPSWQQRVLPDLMRAFPGTQFIVTTHSPQVLTTVKRENIRILSQDDDDKWRAEPPHAESIGVESSVAMNDVMNVNPIPSIPEAVWLSDYTAKIESGTHEDEEGQKLKKNLLGVYGPTHQIMLDVARLIRFQAFKLRSKSKD